MSKNRKGITLLSAIIIIVVLLMFTGTIVISTDYILEETDKKEFVREYKLIKSATQDYVMRNNGNVDFTQTTLDLTNISPEYLSQFDGETILDNTIEMYVIDLDKIGVINTTYGKKAYEDENDVYLLSKTTGVIYYKKGYSYNNNIYYIDNID